MTVSPRRTPPAPLRLSIVIPTYNEQHRLPPTLGAIRAYLDRQGWLAFTEVIVADDGSQDGTGAYATRLIPHWRGLSVLLLPHAGKGAALRQGVLAARGEYVFLCDCDLSMPIVELARFFEAPYDGYDIAIGSREAPGAERFGEPSLRHLMGRVFNRLVRAMVLNGIDDTQCGFKLLRRSVAADLFGRMALDGFGFDVELLALARRRGYSIVEVPIHWYYGRDSRVRPLRDTLRMIAEVWQVRQRLQRQVIHEPNPEVAAIRAYQLAQPAASPAPASAEVLAVPALAHEQHHDVLH